MSIPVLPSCGDNFREEKGRKYWSERVLLKIYIVVCYFSLIIYSTVGSLCSRHALRSARYYRTVCKSFSEILGKLVVKYVSTYTKGRRIHLKKKKNRSANSLCSSFVYVFLAHLSYAQDSYSDHFLFVVHPSGLPSVRLSVHPLTLSNDSSFKAIEGICP